MFTPRSLLIGAAGAILFGIVLIFVVDQTFPPRPTTDHKGVVVQKREFDGRLWFIVKTDKYGRLLPAKVGASRYLQTEVGDRVLIRCRQEHKPYCWGTTY